MTSPHSAQVHLGHRATTHLFCKIPDVQPLANFNTWNTFHFYFRTRILTFELKPCYFNSTKRLTVSKVCINQTPFQNSELGRWQRDLKGSCPFWKTLWLGMSLLFTFFFFQIFSLYSLSSLYILYHITGRKPDLHSIHSTSEPSASFEHFYTGGREMSILRTCWQDCFRLSTVTLNYLDYHFLI